MKSGCYLLILCELTLLFCELANKLCKKARICSAGFAQRDLQLSEVISAAKGG